jgi:surface antigen
MDPDHRMLNLPIRLPALLLLALSVAGLTGCSVASNATRALPLVPDAPAATAQSSDEGVLAALNGGIIGPVAGNRFSDRDRRRALEAEYRALETAPVGQSVAWSNDRTGFSGEVAAAQAYQVGSQNCRQYTHRVNAGGQQIEARGTACRDENGAWTPLT